jgi:hypothetical protein
LPAFITLLTIVAVFLFSSALLNTRNGHDPLRSQRNYFLANALGGIVLGWLLTYLNHYNPLWITDAHWDTVHIALYSLIFAALPPALLSLRALLGSFGGLLKRLAAAPALPVFAADTLAFTLIPLALLGLLGGAAWPTYLCWLFWLSPLLLLVCLQLLWNESTVFAGLDQGDWGRMLCAISAGILLGNLGILVFAASGGELQLELPEPVFAQLGFAIFGLLVLQLGDVLAEAWRGKNWANVFKKKPFPIPVIVKPKK